ncbi:MAG: hypothetical protein HKL90_16230 [Elusimicrobia bacterium]|nr:hypothetical protein [Elusimicrobiota bacterium]
MTAVGSTRLGAVAVLLAALAACVPRAEVSSLSSAAMVAEYGRPDRVESRRLVWEHRGPWSRIVVWDARRAPENEGLKSDIEETIAYSVPDDMRGALSAFSRSLLVSSGGARLSARSTGEDRNFLMLNLADDILHGRLSPQDARVVYLRTLETAAAGKTEASMHTLLFR